MYFYYENIRFIILFIELIFFIFLLPSFIYYIYQKHTEEKIKIKEILTNILRTAASHSLITIILLIISVVAIADMFLKFNYTNHNIGDFYEDKNYTDNFYIFVSRSPFDETSSIKKVTATIHSVRGGLENNSYYIKSMNIGNSEIYIEPVKEIFLNIDTKVYDIEDNIYYVQLTKIKATK